METMKYTVIKSKEQYYTYCNILEELISSNKPNVNDEIELLSLLISKWDTENNSFKELDPIAVSIADSIHLPLCVSEINSTEELVREIRSFDPQM